MYKNSLTLIAIIILNLIAASSYAQGISVFSDYLGKVKIFDTGKTKQIEHLKLKEYVATNNALCYIDNADNFKVYQNHYPFTLSAFVSNYYPTDNLIGYKLNTQLKVFDNGDNISLSSVCKNYSCNKDVIAYFDEISKKLLVYYKGENIELLDGLTSDEITNFTTSKNIVIFKDIRGFYNFFYDNEIYELAHAERLVSAKSGENILAYIEAPINNFQIFFKDEFYEIDDFEPKEFKAGDNLVAYIDYNGYLKAFYQGQIVDLSLDEPDFFEVEDGLIIFSVQNYFKVFWEGKIYTLENYIPDSYKFNNEVVAYKDQLGNLKVFDEGESSIISYETVNDYIINGSTVTYKFGVHSENIYYKGKTYKNN